jgi:hypothetical protein
MRSGMMSPLLTLWLSGCFVQPVESPRSPPPAAPQASSDAKNRLRTAPPPEVRRPPQVAPPMGPVATVRVRPRRAAPLPCRLALKAAKVRFGTFGVRPKRLRGSGGLMCNVVDPVILYRGPSDLRYGAPRVSCAFARRMLRFEKVLQLEAMRAFGEPVKKLMLWSSYRCSIIAGAGGLPSEHAFGNAIDLGGVILRSGRRTTVLRHYPRQGMGKTKRGRFWVRLSKRLHRDGVFTVVLTPRFNRLHHNHLHLDGASYSVDGT